MGKGIKERIRDKLLELGVFATTAAPLAPTSANAKTPDAPEQPKTEQVVSQENNNNNGNRKTIHLSNGITLTPVDEVPHSGRQQAPQRQTTERRRTTQTVSTPREVQYGSPEWLRANGWIYDVQLSNGLNRIGNPDGSHNGYRGAYYKADDPHKIMFFPNDPIHDKPEFASRGNAKASQSDNTSQYYHGDHDPYGYGCPDRKITRQRVGHVVRGLFHGIRGGR